MFQPHVDSASLTDVIEALERGRLEIEALDIRPVVERALHRTIEARGAHLSTRIEGNPMTEEQVRLALARSPGSNDPAEFENRDYREATRLASQVADDATADIDGGLLRGLHYSVLRRTDRAGTRGQYRTTANVIRRGSTVLYEPPPAHLVPSLMDDLVAWLRSARSVVHPLVLAAAAHAELVNVHPFDDGNGRTARALTSYFAYRGGWRLRGLVTTEQVFGEDVQAYYDQLRRFGERYPGQRPDLTPWTRWFLDALLSAVAARYSFVAHFDDLMRESIARGLEGRLIDGAAVIWAAGSISRSEYAAELGVSPATAAHDLSLLAAHGAVRRVGRGRSTRYETVGPSVGEVLAGASLDARSPA